MGRGKEQRRFTGSSIARAAVEPVELLLVLDQKMGSCLSIEGSHRSTYIATLFVGVTDL